MFTVLNPYGVTEVFDTYEEAFEYATMLANYGYVAEVKEKE